MMTSSNEDIFRVTGPVCGKFTGHQWIPRTKASDAELWCFLWSAPEKLLNKQPWIWWFETPSCPLWHHCNVQDSSWHDQLEHCKDSNDTEYGRSLLQNQSWNTSPFDIVLIFYLMDYGIVLVGSYFIVFIFVFFSVTKVKIVTVCPYHRGNYSCTTWPVADFLA